MVLELSDALTKMKKSKTKRLTNLQKRQRLERSRHDTRVRKLKKYPLCVSKRFIAYAHRKKWDNETTDAAALLLHRVFMMRRKSDWKRWLPIPYQVFKALFGENYKKIKDRLIKDGFLEYNCWRKYSVGRYCSYYGICKELRHDAITASYRLQTKVLQERYIETKEYRKGTAKAQRRKCANAILDARFSKSNTDRKKNKSFYDLVIKGHITEEQFVTIKRLVENAWSLDIKIGESEFSELIQKGYAKNRSKKDNDFDFGAYEQWWKNMYNLLPEPRVSVRPNGRFYVPVSHMPKVLWNYASIKSKQLSAVDIKSSHPHCLLALLKDLEINYFNGSGTHDECLSRCQFSRQIGMIPGLVEHLRRTVDIYQTSEHFEFTEHIPNDPIERKKLMYNLFKKFTRLLFNTNSKLKNYLSVKKCDSQVIYTSKSFDHANIFYSNSDYRLENFSNYTNSLISYDYKSSVNPTFLHVNLGKIQSDINFYTVPVLVQESYLTIQKFSELSVFNTFLEPLCCSVYSAGESVGVEAQVEWYQQVADNLLSCHFTPRVWDKVKQPPGDIALFRSLFFPSREEIEEFELMLQDGFYELLMKAIGMEITKVNRDKFKVDFLTFFYRRACTRYKGTHPVFREDGTRYEEKIREPVRLAMETLLPAITHFLDICKCRPGTLDPRWNYHKWISRAIQSIESKIMLEVCANLWKKYPNMFLITLHDAIKCHTKDAKKVQEELMLTFGKYHVSPTFDVKEYKRPSDVNS